MSHHELVVVLAAVAALAVAATSLAVGLGLSRRGLHRRLSRLARALEAHTPGNAGKAPSSGESRKARRGRGGSVEDLLGRLQRAAEAGEPTTAPTAPTAPDEAPASGWEGSARLRQVLDALPQGVVICAAGTKVTLKNATASSLLDGQPEVLAARAVDELLEESAGGAPAKRTVELYGPPKRILTVRTVPVRDPSGLVGVLAVIDDVSELHRLEAVRRDFVANLSHELKTPVGALGLLAETLVDEDNPLVARHLADRIQAESVRLSRIVEDLLDLSRIEGSEGPPKEPVEVNKVMSEALEGVRTIAQAREVELVLEEPEGSFFVLGDRRQLTSALHNLLDNAVKFTDASTPVTLSAAADGAWVDIVVRDHGMGIPATDLDRVFERFYRVDRGRGRDSGGTGLGLAIVRHVANNHGGRVGVFSREGEGATFTLRLPLVLTEAPGAPSSIPAQVGEA
ncbi:MAG: ATP-binding protein [Acidimicrobiales bacterium]